jgi:hypothetical protein
MKARKCGNARQTKKTRVREPTSTARHPSTAMRTPNANANATHIVLSVQIAYRRRQRTRGRGAGKWSPAPSPPQKGRPPSLRVACPTSAAAQLWIGCKKCVASNWTAPRVVRHPVGVRGRCACARRRVVLGRTVRSTLVVIEICSFFAYTFYLVVDCWTRCSCCPAVPPSLCCCCTVLPAVRRIPTPDRLRNTHYILFASCSWACFSFAPLARCCTRLTSHVFAAAILTHRPLGVTNSVASRAP